MSLRLCSWLHTYPSLNLARWCWGLDPSAKRRMVTVACHAQHQTFQWGKELGPGEKQPPATAMLGGCLPCPNLEAWLDQEMVPKSLLLPRLSPSPWYRGA